MNNKKTVVLKQTALGDGVPKICIPVTGVTEREIMEQSSAACGEAGSAGMACGFLRKNRRGGRLRKKF